ncbi:MAG: long-chain-fatty-acid--CoA ligase [Acidobacteriota bacterium]
MNLPLTPVRFLQRAVDLYGTKAGILCGDRIFTYREFGDRARRLASALVECLGVAPGDRVAFLSLNNHQLLEAYYGVIQARAVLMPLNVRLTPAELAGVLAHSGARVLFYEADFAPLVEKLRPEKSISLDAAYEDLLAQGHPTPADILAYDENAPAELFYTSGSTGTPKGVLLSHRTLYLHALDILTDMDCNDRSVELHTIPLFHANGWGRPQLATLQGATQVLVRRFEPTLVFRLIERHRATDMSLVPTMATALLNSPDLGKFDLSSMKLVHIGGGPSSPELIERMEKAFGCRTVAGYGLTETAPVVSTARPKSTFTPATDAERYRRQAMAGLPFPGVEVRVVDAEMRDVPRDMKSVGELIVRSDHVMDGYYKDPEASAAVLKDGWLRTGDMAVWDEETYIHIVDRKKEIIVSGGENISSIEVEKAILAHPDVYECAVVAAPDEQWGETPAAIVVRKPGTSLTAEDLASFLEGRLAHFKTPRRIEITEEQLPKTGTGKIRKLVLRERFWANHARRVH